MKKHKQKDQDQVALGIINVNIGSSQATYASMVIQEFRDCNH